MEHPELAGSVYEAFVKSKQAALARYREGQTEMNILTPVPWVTALLAHNAAEFPGDWWPYGIAANRKALETFTRYFYEQGLSRRRFAIEEVFAQTLLDT